MKPAVMPDDLPGMPATVRVVQQRGQKIGDGLNWSAATAGFVCPGAGQFMVGKKAAGVMFFCFFVVACGISLIPLFACLVSSTQVALGRAAEARPIPWLLVLGGFAIAILTWLAAMIQAAFLQVEEPG